MAPNPANVFGSCNALGQQELLTSSSSLSPFEARPIQTFLQNAAAEFAGLQELSGEDPHKHTRESLAPTPSARRSQSGGVSLRTLGRAICRSPDVSTVDRVENFAEEHVQENTPFYFEFCDEDVYETEPIGGARGIESLACMCVYLYKANGRAQACVCLDSIPHVNNRGLEHGDESENSYLDKLDCYVYTNYTTEVEETVTDMVKPKNKADRKNKKHGHKQAHTGTPSTCETCCATTSARFQRKWEENVNNTRTRDERKREEKRLMWEFLKRKESGGVRNSSKKFVVKPKRKGGKGKRNSKKGSTVSGADNSDPLIAILLSLQHREITPDDYEILLRLDELVAPKTLTRNYVRRVAPSFSFTPNPCEGDNVCGVCLECMEEGCSVRRIMQCGHVFHAACLLEWLTMVGVTCPLDRTCVLPE